jgi:hypothetical protein
MYDPRVNPTPHSSTRSPVAGNRLTAKPVYVLTSGSTISAAERFCYALNMLKRVTLIGFRQKAVGGFRAKWPNTILIHTPIHARCGHCQQCRLGEAHICQNLGIIGIDRDGAFAEFVKIPASNIWRRRAADQDGKDGGNGAIRASTLGL